MSTQKPKSRTEASKPAQTKHLTAAQKRSLDHQAEIEHMDGPQRERATQKVAREK